MYEFSTINLSIFSKNSVKVLKFWLRTTQEVYIRVVPMLETIYGFYTY